MSMIQSNALDDIQVVLNDDGGVALVGRVTWRASPKYPQVQAVVGSSST